MHFNHHEADMAREAKQAEAWKAQNSRNKTNISCSRLSESQSFRMNSGVVASPPSAEAGDLASPAVVDFSDDVAELAFSEGEVDIETWNAISLMITLRISRN